MAQFCSDLVPVVCFPKDTAADLLSDVTDWSIIGLYFIA